MNDWLRIIEPTASPRPNPGQEQHRRNLGKEIQALRARGSGVVTHFEDVATTAIQRAQQEGVNSDVVAVLEGLNSEARQVYARFEAAVNQLFGTTQGSQVEPQLTMSSAPHEPITPPVPLSVVDLSASDSVASAQQGREESLLSISPNDGRPITPFSQEVAPVVAQHFNAVIDEADAAVDAEGAVIDPEGSGVYGLFQRLRALPVKEWPVVKALLRKKRSTSTMAQLGVLLPALLFGGASHSEARETPARTEEVDVESSPLPVVDKTYSWDDIYKHPEKVEKVFERFYREWQQLQQGKSIPQKNERYVMPPVVLMKFMEPTGSGSSKEYEPRFVVQVVDKDLDKRGRTVSNNLLGSRLTWLKTEQDWQEFRVLIKALLGPGIIDESERSTLVAAAERNRVRYGDPVPEQEGEAADYRNRDERSMYPRRQYDPSLSSSTRRNPRRPTVGPTGLPMYTIGSGVTKSTNPSHVPTERERQMTTLRLLEATFGPLPGRGDDFNPRTRVVELGEHTHDDESESHTHEVMDDRVASDIVGTEEAHGQEDTTAVFPPAPETTGEDVLDFSTSQQTTAEDLERLDTITTYLATAFETGNSFSQRHEALQILLNNYGTPTPEGGRQYRLDQFLFQLHGDVLSVEVQQSGGTTQTYDLSSAETLAEFDRYMLNM